MQLYVDREQHNRAVDVVMQFLRGKDQPAVPVTASKPAPKTRPKVKRRSVRILLTTVQVAAVAALIALGSAVWPTTAARPSSRPCTVQHRPAPVSDAPGISGSPAPDAQCDDGGMPVRAVLFDFSGTLFRLEEDDSWFAGMELIDDDGRRAVDEHVQAELMERLTHPTGGSVTRTEEAYRAWVNRDLTPALHREAYLHALRDAGLPDHHAEALYQRAVDPASWVPYPDTVEVLRSLQGPRPAHRHRLQHRVRHPPGVPRPRAPTPTSSSCPSKSVWSNPIRGSSRSRCSASASPPTRP